MDRVGDGGSSGPDDDDGAGVELTVHDDLGPSLFKCQLRELLVAGHERLLSLLKVFHLLQGLYFRFSQRWRQRQQGAAGVLEKLLAERSGEGPQTFCDRGPALLQFFQFS